MNIDQHLSKKTFYETMLKDRKKGKLPIEVLGEMFHEENKKELADLSDIRYAQGEIYFHYQDYEAAIFKWESISNELGAWAKKNVGDAYFELDLYPTAIETFKSIVTDNNLLNTEIALKLFQIYVEEEKYDLATDYIKQAVALDPDYPKITKIARYFFEQNNDNDNAIDLALNEGLRTEDVHWFDMLTGYINDGKAQSHEPSYFYLALENLYSVDSVRFEKMVVALWNQYKSSENYVNWLETIDSIIENIDVSKSTAWNQISNLYYDSFKDSLSGKIELDESIRFMPKFLENWLGITKSTQAIWTYTAILTWNEFYPSVIREEVIEEAKRDLWKCAVNPEILQDCLSLFQDLTKWANENDIEIGAKVRWLVQEIMDLSYTNVFVAGVNGTGKSAFINSILEEELFENSTTNTVRIKNGNVSQVTVVSDEELQTDTVVPDIKQLITEELSEHSRTLIDVAMPSTVLKKHSISITDTPGFRVRRNDPELMEYLPLADELLFVLDAEDAFTDQERDLAQQIIDKNPAISVNFVLTKLDSIYNKQEAAKLVEDVTEKVQQYFPDSDVIPFSSKYAVAGQQETVQNLLTSFANKPNKEEIRSSKLLQMIQRVIVFFLKNRVEKENEYKDDIVWNEEIVSKMNAAIHQLKDHENALADTIYNKYVYVKADIKEEMAKRIPEILRECASFLKEDSDFRKIHLDLNDEMNRRLQEYIQSSVLPSVNNSMQNWISDAKQELLENKNYLDEMSATFNNIYGEQVLNLEGDFRILNDWERDISRMTSGAQLERENILLRHTPSQFLLKSAGKLLGAIAQNKALYNQYKKFIENEEYTETANSVINKFFTQYEIFEKGIERDLAFFFKEPIKDIQELIQKAEEEIEAKQALLAEMKENPEIYYDAITSFKIRHRQFELMNTAAGTTSGSKAIEHA
ncbi:dynamin family protein [Bacillus sp. AGMB 02131]|uniref:Dynamin family protein n=1 Tax=Peribacillus faecalis TaxID=2772559 RepID=A0A927CXU4_9BACI|nr:dynamin family protein [Peribacillus faecalis]MBD3109713.1 dynamin family protein [Peribacillus faecalis]